MICAFNVMQKRAVRSFTVILGLLALSGLTACDLTDVTNPTKLEEGDIATPTGADLMRRAALRELYAAAVVGAEYSGLLADEFYDMQPSTLQPQGVLDLRQSLAFIGSSAEFTALYSGWQEVRRAATLAMSRIEESASTARRASGLGLMYTARGYAAVRLGEDFCPGFPLHELDGYTLVFGQPLTTTDAVLERALADLDSAVVLAADSARILNFARVVRGRTLLGLARFANAATAVEAVPTSYAMQAEYGLDAQYNGIYNGLWFLMDPCCGPIGSVADLEGGNGLNFVSAGDPRVQTVSVQIWNGTPRYRPTKYSTWDAPMVLASGIEARLIQAEAALKAGSSSWLNILNDLRATQISPALPPLTDPASPDGRVDLLFRERSFWLFGTGQRLSDLRRLMRQYGRSAETVYPTGIHIGGETYGTATSMRFPVSSEAAFNPAVIGCTAQ